MCPRIPTCVSEEKAALLHVHSREQRKEEMGKGREREREKQRWRGTVGKKRESSRMKEIHVTRKHSTLNYTMYTPQCSC